MVRPERDSRDRTVVEELYQACGWKSREGLARRLERAGPWLVAALAGLWAFRRLDDYDTWWHLASGRWIATHRMVPATDVLSHTVPDHPWVNLQWGYDLVLYLLYEAGGPTLLVLAEAAGFTIAMVLLLRLLREEIGDGAAALLGLCALTVVQDRFMIRPEMLSFPLLAALLLVLESGRRRGGRRLWLPVPLMLVWANTHSLFVIGVFGIFCAIAGAAAARWGLLPAGWREGSSWEPRSFRALLASGAAAIAVTLVNPFFLRGALFPLKLMSRINGSNPVFATIGEFRRPFGSSLRSLDAAAYKLMLIAGALVVAAAAIAALPRAAGRRQDARGGAGFDVGGLLFFAGLAYVSTLAWRNLALFAIAGTPVVARSLALLARRLPEPVRARLASPSRLAAGIAVAAAAPLGALFIATNAYYSWDGKTHEFGTGILEANFPIRASAFVREAELPANLYNDLTAGGYLAWDDPCGAGVFMDGRLEVYDEQFFAQYTETLSSARAWRQAEEAHRLNTAVIFHRWSNRHPLIERLVRSGGWELVYADEVAVVLVRRAGNEEAIARARGLVPAWDERTWRRLSAPVPRWPRPIGRIEELSAYASLMKTLGRLEEATRARRLLARIR